MHSVSDIITIHGPDGEIEHLGGHGAAALGWSDPPRMADLAPFVERRTWLRMLRAFRRWRRIGFGSLEFAVQLPDGSRRHLESVATSMLGDPSIGGVVVTTRDVTERHAIADRLGHEATHDGLTDLPNRSLFNDRLRQALTQQRRAPAPVALLLIDLDNFKNINDSYGHPAGDDVLRAVASLLGVGLRAEDTLARLGGDEFAIVCPDVSPHTAERIARRLQRTLIRPFTADGHEVYLGASVGIAISEPDAAVDATELMRNADLALYQSKAAGRSCVSVFDERLELRALRRMDIETELRGALTRQELSVVYQPVIDLRTGRVSTHEALLRWHHPRMGDVSPDEFVPVAEDCGLIVPLGRWVLEQACVHLAEWRRTHPTADAHVSVNISARQLVDPSFAGELLDVLQRNDVPADAVTLEVTETALIAELIDSSEALRNLRALGVRVALDDFGTGYSSLTYLKHLPVDVLKIDKSFIEDVGHSSHDQAVVGGVARMARALGLRVIAEGVEDERQRDHLRALGCDQAQGYLFSRPRAHADVLASLDVVHDVGDGTGAEDDLAPDAPNEVPALGVPDTASAVADLVHELMQPLTVIKSFAENFRLLAQSDDIADMAVVADAISRNAAAAVTIVQSLADSGALERGTLRLERDPTSLEQTLTDLVTDLQQMIDVPIELDVADDVTVDLDVDRFRQIMTNLVTNAAKFAPAGTPIVVRLAASESDDATISVIDSGPGVPAELRHHLFDKYRKHGRQRGSGIGLHVARQLARLHGGELRCRRAHTGGAEFVLSLPCTTDGAVVAAPAPPASRSASSLDVLPCDDGGALAALHGATSELLRARSPERVVSISIGLVRDLGGTVVPAAFADPEAIPIDLSMGHGPPLLPSAPPLTVARMRLERLLPLFVEDARDAMQASRGLLDDRRFDADTGVHSRWPLARSIQSAAPGCEVLVARVSGDEPDGSRMLARVLRSVSDHGDVIGVWDPDVLVVVRGADDEGHELVQEVEDQWSRWGGTSRLELAAVLADGTVSPEDLVRAGLQLLTGDR